MVTVPLLIAGVGALIDPEGIGGFVARLGRSAAIFAGICVSISAVQCLVIARLPESLPNWQRVGLTLVGIFFCILVWLEVAAHVLVGLGVFRGIDVSRGLLLRIGGLVGLGVIALQWGLDRIDVQRHASERRIEELRSESLQAQLSALQAATNPHFLFNTLNTIACLIEEDPVAAERAVERLSDLYRYILEGSRLGSVSVFEEIGAVRDYLAIEQLRFGERLRVELNVAARAEVLRMPPLTLQPLVENGVKHGIAARAAGGLLVITVAVEAVKGRSATLILSVEDDGPGLGASRHVGSGTALANLRERLRLAYGDSARLLLERGDLGGLRACVRLPLRRHEWADDGDDGSPSPALEEAER